MMREDFRKGDIVAVNTEFGQFALAVVRTVDSGYVGVVFPVSEKDRRYKSSKTATDSIRDSEFLRNEAENCPEPVRIQKTNMILAQRRTN